ncbi:MAG: methyl-accepting chemotaxis protein [Geobacteraceae bacterium]|nr:methyl-accepting chemotaxis protein [Geobacteraceae bacterium]
MNNTASPAETAKPMTAYEEIQRLAEAMMNGELGARGNSDAYQGADSELISLVNRMLDTLIAPLHLAADAIAEIAHGRIPPFVIDEYKGEYNDIKRNLNSLLATLYGMHHETQHLIGNIQEGRLRTRGNDWDFEGIWRDLICGVNGTLDAVIDPVSEASDVLGRLAAYDLGARMQGKYRGEHAVIKKAMNTTAESLHSAISQVSETVDLVSDVGSRITQSSEIVSKGALEQGRQLSETSANMLRISEISSKSAQSTVDARRSAQSASDSITKAKDAMNRMLEAMSEIRGSADNTANIIQEIDAIAKETDSLSSGASAKAVRMRTSAGGFGVVASEIRRLSLQCKDVVSRLEVFSARIDPIIATLEPGEAEQLKNDFQYLIEDLDNIAMMSNLLGVNAAIEAAHVEGAGNDFKIVTEDIQVLAKRSTDAARRTEVLIQSSVKLARNGELLSREIDSNLVGAVEGARTIGLLTDEISRASLEQANGLNQISQAVEQLNSVTNQNTESAVESSEAARNLARQVKKLSATVNKFQLGAQV